MNPLKLGLDAAGISSALDALEVAHLQVQEAEAGVDAAKRNLSEAARRFLMEAPEEELLSRAGLVYWNLPEVPVALIASVVIGDPAKVQKLAPLLPAEDSEIRCGVCHGAIQVKSRSALVELQKRVNHRRSPWGVPTCKTCQEEEAKRRADGYGAQRQSEGERLQALHTMPYQDYLLTEEWLEIRNRKLKQARFACQLCNGGGRLNVHHRTYDRRGYEDMADLIALCRSCHANFHGRPAA